MAATDQQQEIEALRARVEQLERELADQQARTNRAIAHAQDRIYWLDRWRVDLNGLMATAWASRLRAAARGVRKPLRAVIRLVK